MKNLVARILTAACLLGVFIPALFYAPTGFWALGTLLVVLLAFDEWNCLLKWPKRHLVVWLIIAAALGLGLTYFGQKNGFHWLFFKSLPIFLAVTLFWLCIAPIGLAKRLLPSNRLGMTLLGLLLLGALWLAVVNLQWANPWLLLIAMVTVWIADSAAYVAGKNFGKHKLAPNISPGKTWEGVAGAYAAVTVFALVLVLGFHIGDGWLFLALWLITAVSIMGDLFESLLKRHADVKDSGSLLPGHGGVLDRIDALVPAMPLAVLLIYGYNYFLRIA